MDGVLKTRISKKAEDVQRVIDKKFNH